MPFICIYSDYSFDYDVFYEMGQYFIEKYLEISKRG